MPKLEAPAQPQQSNDAFPERAFIAFERAAQHLGEQRVWLEIAGQFVLLRCAGQAILDAYFPALRGNLTLTHHNADFEICLFESALSGVSLPAHPISLETALPKSERAILHTVQYRAALDVNSEVLQLLEPARRRAIVWQRDTSKSTHHRAAPLLQTLSWWLERRNCIVAHAAAVGICGTGVLLTGRGGSGKSTTALHCLIAGMQYVSDDYCAVTSDARGWNAYHLYNTGKIASDNLHRLPASVSGQLDDIGIDKRVIFIEPGLSVARTLRLTAVIVPQICPGDARLEPLSVLKAVQALALSTVFQTLGDDVNRVRLLTQLCRDLPCMSLRLGDDPTVLPQVLQGYLEHL